MSTGSDPVQAPLDAVAWHDAECGGYQADLGFWGELARQSSGPVLELGAGTGRVSLHLAAAGAEVIAVERDPALAAELERRASQEDARPTVMTADLRELDRASLPSPPSLLIAPMHVVQTFPEGERRELVEAGARLLAPGGRLALVVIEESRSSELAGGELAPLPDIREVDGWVFSSEPLWVEVTAETIRARRIRKRVAPGGELDTSVHDDILYRVSPDELERVGSELGLRAAGRREIRSSSIESDSIVVILEAP